MIGFYDMTQSKKDGAQAIAVLLSATNQILDLLIRVVKKNGFDYRTFGTAIEKHISAALVALFRSTGFIVNESDYAMAPHKNYFPDFELKTIPPLAIEFKSGNRRQNRNGTWILTKNSENDMGTLAEWPKRTQKYGGENIYYVFVVYSFDDTTKEIKNVEIEPFYRFIGVANKGRVLKYREKDGNLRPKNFDAESPVKTFQQFQDMFAHTVVYRSKRIIKKHRGIIKRVQIDSK